MQAHSTVRRALIRVAATVAIALVSAAAMATEATPLETVPPARTRAEVIAERTQAPHRPSAVQRGEATVFVDATGARSRAEVRSEAVRAMHDRRFDALDVGA
jgi:hypothetical protein